MLFNVADDRTRDERHDNAERQVDDDEIQREHRPALFEPKVSGAAPRQEKEKQRQQRRQDVDQADYVKVVPGGFDDQAERDAPQSAPEQRLVDFRRLQRYRLFYAEFLAQP